MRRDFGKRPRHLALVKDFGRSVARVTGWFLNNLCRLRGERSAKDLRIKKAKRAFQPDVKEVAEISVRHSIVIRGISDYSVKAVVAKRQTRRGSLMRCTRPIRRKGSVLE